MLSFRRNSLERCEPSTISLKRCWRIRPGEIERLRTAQLQLLQNVAPLLRPGGILVYSTCSLEPEENREVVGQFLREQEGFKLDRERELLPFADAVDGAFVARILRAF